MTRTLVVFLLLSPGAADASGDNAGTSSAQFLGLGAGARALGLGDAYAAVAEGPDALHWNPAGLARAKRPEASYTRTELVFDLHQDFAAYAHPVRLLRGVVGAGFAHFSQESIPVVTKANIRLPEGFAPHSEAFTLGYATRFRTGDGGLDRFGSSWEARALPWVERPLVSETEPWTGEVLAGASAKVLTETIHQRRTVAFAFDAGVIFHPEGLSELALAGAMRNLGTAERFNRENERLPLEFEAGAAYEWRRPRGRTLAAAGVVAPYHGLPFGKVGLEQSMRLGRAGSAALRVGYKSRPAIDLSPLAGLTAGAGGAWRRLSIDFGFEPLAELGGLYRISLAWRW